MTGVEALRAGSGLLFASRPSRGVLPWKEASMSWGVEISYRSNEDFLGRGGVPFTALDTGAGAVRWNLGGLAGVLDGSTASKEGEKHNEFETPPSFLTSRVVSVSCSPSELSSSAYNRRKYSSLS